MKLCLEILEAGAREQALEPDRSALAGLHRVAGEDRVGHDDDGQITQRIEVREISDRRYEGHDGRNAGEPTQTQAGRERVTKHDEREQWQMECDQAEQASPTPTDTPMPRRDRPADGAPVERHR